MSDGASDGCSMQIADIFLFYKRQSASLRETHFNIIMIMERIDSPTLGFRAKQDGLKTGEAMCVEMPKDMNRKIHDDFVATSRKNITDCQHKIINVRERLASLEIGNHEKTYDQCDNVNDKGVETVHQPTRGIKSPPKVKEKNKIEQETKRSIKQRSLSFDDPASIKRRSHPNPAKILNRGNSESLMWAKFSRYSSETDWPETSSQNGPKTEQNSSCDRNLKLSRKLSDLPRLAIRRNSDPMAQREPPRVRSFEKVSDANSKEMGEMYHGSLFRVVRHSMCALGGRPRSSIGHVWQKSDDIFNDTPTNVIPRFARKPQPPSTPKKHLIHCKNHQALVGKQYRPHSFRNRTTTI